MTGVAAPVVFRPVGPLRGRVRVPGDKSVTQRALLIGAVCDGPVTVEGPVWAGDPLATAGMVADLGVRVAGLDERAPVAVVHGAGLRGLRPPGRPLDARNSGTGMRLLAGLLAGQRGRFTVDGDATLRVRPMSRVVEPLRAMGVRIDAREGRFAPLVIEGGEVLPVRYEPPVASAQVKSCVLLAGLFAANGGETVVVEPTPTRDHTERLLAAAGVPVRRAGREVGVTGVDGLSLDRVRVPGDPSSSAFLVAAALLVPGSSIEIDGVGLNPTRLGFYEVARRMGGDVTWEVTDDSGPEPVGVLRAVASALRGVNTAAAETAPMIDEVTLVALLASFAEGETVLEGVAELRAKESDRLQAVVEILGALGAAAEASGDTLRVRGSSGAAGRSPRGGAVDSRGDHRLALLGAVAGLACPNGVRIAGFDSSEVSFPGFTSTLAEVLSP